MVAIDRRKTIRNLLQDMEDDCQINIRKYRVLKNITQFEKGQLYVYLKTSTALQKLIYKER